MFTAGFLVGQLMGWWALCLVAALLVLYLWTQLDD